MIVSDKRTLDVDGRLHITDCCLTAARVNEYLGSEIPDVEGLEASRRYRLFRDPQALEAAVPLFENQPLMATHVPVSAADPKKFYIVGTVSNARWKPPHVVADVSIWDAAAIARVRDGSQKEISVGYRYTCDMTPGVIDGERFEGRMLSIQPNHIALVAEGRVGPDCVVGDQMPLETEMQKLLTASIAKVIAPFLSAEADKKKLAIALDEVLSGPEKPDEAAADERRGFYGHHSKDWNTMDDAAKQAARDTWHSKRRARDKLPDESDPRRDFDPGDSALAADEIRKQLRAEAQAATIAREAVRSIVGVVVMDSADEIFRFALKHLKVDTKGIHPSALAALFEAHAARRRSAETHRALANDGWRAEFGIADIWKEVAA